MGGGIDRFLGGVLLQKMQEVKKDDFSLNQLARKRFRVSETATWRICVHP